MATPSDRRIQEAVSEREDLIAAARQDAEEKDRIYARRDRRARRSWVRWALLGSVPALVLAGGWSFLTLSSTPQPAPADQALDLARTLHLTIAEVENFVGRNGRLPVPAEAAAFLPDGAVFTPGGAPNAYELVLPAPVVGQLRYGNHREPDAWLDDVTSSILGGGVE